jgi:hypothetical protein
MHRGDAEDGRESREFTWSRLSFAAAVVVMIVGTFASFGGLSYAASGGARAAHALAKVTTAHKVVVGHSAAAGQYPKETQAPFKPPAQVSARSQGPLAATQASTLPFTGVSLLATVLLSVAFMGTGLLLRRAGRRARS